ncbi:MAG: glycosyltransferase family 39 protein, partial [Candidatus Magasanikiibacteriota bacterium]
MKKRAFLIAIILIIAFGFFLRIYNLSTQSYWIDEGYTINAVEAIKTHGYPLLDSGKIYSGQYLPNYLTALSTFIFGNTEFAYRFPSVLFGSATILLVFFLAKKLFNSDVGYIASIVTALSTWEITWSRQARGYAALHFFYLLTAYFVWELCQKFTTKKFIFFTLASLLAYLSHPIGAISFPLGLLMIASRYINKTNLKQIWLTIKETKKTSLPLVVVILAVLLFLQKTLFLFVDRMFNKSFNLSDSYLSFLLSTYPIILGCALISIIYLFIKKTERNQGWFFLILLALPLLAIVNATEILHFRYLFFLFPMLIILFAFALERTVSLIFPLPTKYLVMIILT